MVDEMPKMSREFLEAGSLKVAKREEGCRELTAVKIAMTHPPGNGPNWYLVSFTPGLSPQTAKNARLAIARPAGQYALMGE
jgi:hypothetical protein